jgi:predicted MFS family arabinose efflux permease
MTPKLARPLIVALAVSIAGALPGFLFGAVAVAMRPELHFSIPSIGIGMAAFFAASALACPPCGRITERIGATRAMRISALGAVVVLLAMAVVPHSFAPLVALLVAGGLVQGFASPAVNMYMAQQISPARHGLAFGVKQASIPGALLLAGASLPAIALTAGWRWVFVFGAAVAVVALALLSRREPVRGPEPAAPDDARSGRRTGARWVAQLSLAAGLASFAPHSMGSFLVPTAIHDAGMATGTAGILLAGGSVLALLSRLAVGEMADRTGLATLRPIGAMMAIGCGGLCAVALGSPAPLVAGTCLACAGGWGWASLFHLAVVRFNPHAPAAATGVAQAGIYWGAALAPLTFGVVLDHSSYATAWAVAAVVTAIAVLMVFVADAGRRASAVART